MNILNIRNVLIIGDATVKKPKKIADEIQNFAKKFDDELYTKDIIRRAKGLIEVFKRQNIYQGFTSYVDLPDDNGVVVLTSRHLSPGEIRINKELISALGTEMYASVQAIGFPTSYEEISQNLYAITVRTNDGITIVYADSLAA